MLKKCVGLLMVCLWSVSASAIVVTDDSSDYDGTDVGTVDELVGEIGKREFRDLIAGQGFRGFRADAEQFWSNSLMGGDTELSLNSSTAGVGYLATDVENVYAILMPNEPGYYIVKNANFWGLFENTGASNWAVFDTSKLSSGFQLGEGPFQVDHVSGLDNVSPVPLPASMPMMGAALVVFVWMRKRMAKAKAKA
ncbi:conserved hypothetical protein [Teredinibacter turnerae T7901]|uniref:PEP-CTERM exosortase interaction domain protein n=1 Tax=Teredinibacter turnerae (strain ATCC 39867 / T7901) TaxID=377629 RepID=C5BQE3_TERTT|nr:hypothetical protein [Teredinibacter turnerae]ACR13371.1 conserved hypothetical protein [Teredinibacter turnerae T7901]